VPASAMTISEAFERVPGADDELRSGLPQRALRNKFHKTKLCNFFQNGRCTKHRSCNFAHAREELSDLPDLRQTKLCPAVLEDGGECAVTDCNFAHSPSEVRAPARPLHPWQSKPDGDTLESDPAPTEASPIDARIKAWKRQFSLAGQAQNVQAESGTESSLSAGSERSMVRVDSSRFSSLSTSASSPGETRRTRNAVSRSHLPEPSGPQPQARLPRPLARMPECSLPDVSLPPLCGRLRRGGGESGGCGSGLWRKEHFAMTSRKVYVKNTFVDVDDSDVSEDASVLRRSLSATF